MWTCFVSHVNQSSTIETDAAIHAAVDTFHTLTFDGNPGDRERFQDQMLQRFLTQPQSASREDIDYLLDRLGRRAAFEAPAMARSA